ncbi:uncharacterized protein LOC123529037 [Mercenaria mercenaria]|uniref:uncharacterized protein LOC123529037 n=1 Tax=Mercenaria mercenaria TaxID=6596 RepID=UPI00234ED41A|nr:uncharacterized protein LOC123529037 [Mercenaria mercenaria]
MTDNNPHVLKEYNPDYVPGTTPSQRHGKHECSQEKSLGSLQDTRSLEHNSHKRSDYISVASARSNARSVTTSGQKSAGKKSRKSDDQEERENNQRYEDLSNKWDQAKEEVRLEDHEVLREKVSLQQELIRKQDEYAQQRRKQQLQAETEKRESERAKKQAKQEELQQICKQSLEEDKKAQRDGKQATKSKPRNGLSTFSTSPSATSSPSKSPTTPTTPGGRRSNPFKMTLPAVAPTPDIPGSDDEEDEEQKESTPVKALPWHEQQLYKLYGKKADYFLHPKIENKTQEKKTNPKLRRQGVDQLFDNYWKEYEDGRAGAEALWQTLRYDSNQRLLKEDNIIPEELKEAYGSFARQSLKKSRIPVRRMFCTEDDLPEMPRLLDNRRVQRVRKMRHKSDLMYRASVSNQDRTEVLTFNNPLPEFHERCEGIDQYLPSWQDDFYSDSTVADYVRWLKTKDLVAHENTIQEEDDYEGETKPLQVTQSLDDDMVYMLSRKHKPQQKQKYLFLSEKDTTVKGTFSEKYKGERENKDIPRPYQGDVPKSYSALGGMISATPDISKPSSMLRYSAPLPTRSLGINTYTSSWQPLSMHALVEYKKQVSTVGEGDFNLGRTKMWSHIPVV